MICRESGCDVCVCVFFFWSESGEVTQPDSKEVQAVFCVKSRPSGRYKHCTIRGITAYYSGVLYALLTPSEV